LYEIVRARRARLVAARRRRYALPVGPDHREGLRRLLKIFRRAPAAAASFGFACLSGCHPAPQAALPTGTVVNPPARFTLDTPVEKIAADPAGNAVLHRDVPGLMASSSYIMIEDMSLSQIASISNGRLTQKKLNILQADLAALSPHTP